MLWVKHADRSVRLEFGKIQLSRGSDKHLMYLDINVNRKIFTEWRYSTVITCKINLSPSAIGCCSRCLWGLVLGLRFVLQLFVSFLVLQ